jgi:hypothetical protein
VTNQTFKFCVKAVIKIKQEVSGLLEMNLRRKGESWKMDETRKLNAETVRDIIDIEITWLRMTVPNNHRAVESLQNVKKKLSL